MSNRILHVNLYDHSLVPAEAEVHVTVALERIDGGTEVRGRLMGPHCCFASTVEVAYHLRRMPTPAGPALKFKAVIPEASLWAPETPHLYAGPIELWQDGVRCDVAVVRHGLRQVALGPNGLRLNGQDVRLRGQTLANCTDAAALALRQEGCNLILATVEDESRHVWETADRLGFFVLGRISNSVQAALAQTLTRHPSCLGWLLSGEALSGENLPAGTLVGCALDAAAPAQANFVTAPAMDVSRIETSGPVLLLADREELPVGETRAVVLGLAMG